MRDEYKTTEGEVRWDGQATTIEYFDDPIPPEGNGWTLVGSTMTELRFSRQYILWFWRRSVLADPCPP